MQCTVYPITGTLTSYCWYPLSATGMTDEQIQTLLYKYGPTVAAMNADSSVMKYVTDIYNGNCPTRVNHAVTIVGYTAKYWIIKNSWGSGWGNKGFFKLPRKENKCGINSISGVPFYRSRGQSNS